MRAYFAASDVPQDFWPYAADHVCKLHNALPSRSLENEISPYEQVFKRKPDLSRFRVWGCKCYFHLNDRDKLLLESTKLDGTAVRAVHLGYDEQRLRAYHVYVPSLNRITTGYHVNFNESQFVDLRDELQGRNQTKLTQKPSVSNTQREVLRRIPRGQDEVREDNYLENNNGNRTGNDTLVPGGLHPLVPQQTVHDPESVVPRPVDDLRHGTQHDWDENHCENSACTFPKGHPGLCSHQLVGERLRKRTHQAHFIDSTTLPSTCDDDRLDGVFDICFTGDSDSSNDSPNKRIFSIHLAESKDIPIPRTYEEAMASKYWKEWKAAMDKEIQSLLTHKTWKEIDSLPAGRKATKSRWVYTIKYNRDGTIDRFKARFVVCGYSQQAGIDYDRTFSATMRASSFRTLLAVASALKLRLEHVDVTSAFTQADLDDVDIFINPPRGYETKGADGKPLLLQLLRALYGTKQASCLWQDTLKKWLLSYGFVQSISDPCIFTLKKDGCKPLIVGVYVDDLVVAHDSSTPDVFDGFIKAFTKHFNAKHEGRLRWFLGMAVDQSDDCKRISIHQSKYIHDCCEKFFPNFESHNVKYDVPGSRELYAKLDFAETDEERESMSNVPYLQIVGSILYACVMTRPDCMFYISNLCRYLSNPSRACFKAAQQLLMYLGKTRDLKITFGDTQRLPSYFQPFAESLRKNHGFHAFSDSSWGVPNPMAGFSVFMSGGVISYQARRIKSKLCVAGDSSCETEYAAAAATCKEINFLRGIMSDMGFIPEGPIILAVDNDAAIKVANDVGVTKRNMHFERAAHYVRHAVMHNRVQLVWVDTKMQMADFHSKVVDSTSFFSNRNYHLRS